MILKKICYILIITLIIMISCCGCKIERKNIDAPISDTNHLYWKNINVTVTEFSYNQWFAGYMHKVIKTTVHSDEYDLTKSFTLIDSQTDSYYNCRKGDTVTAKLYTWKNNDTGTINRREIHSLEYT